MDLVENQNIEVNGSIENVPIVDRTNQETSPNTVEKYLNAYIHALSCVDSKCVYEKCIQFKRAIQHSKTCLKYQQCKFCYQLIALSCYHSKQCNDKSCSVPFCISIKIKLNSIIEMKNIKKFIIENSSYSKMFMQHSVDAHTQTDNLLKRKRSNDHLTSLKSLSEDNASQEEEKEPAEFITKLKAIKDKQQTPNQKPNKMLNKILPNQRKDLVNFVFEISVNKSLAQNNLSVNNIDFKNKNLARYAYYLIRKEQEINDSLRDADDYFYLLAELAFKAKLEMEKFLTPKKENFQVQCDLNEILDSDLDDEPFATIKKAKLN
jgi:hypothetical protein